MKAITKAQVNEAVGNREFPDFVIEAFNECIVEAKMKGTTTVYQDDVVERILVKTDTTRQAVYDNHWLDVEDYYRKAGWTVIYDKPAYNETYKANWTFK